MQNVSPQGTRQESMAIVYVPGIVWMIMVVRQRTHTQPAVGCLSWVTTALGSIGWRRLPLDESGVNVLHVLMLYRLY